MSLVQPFLLAFATATALAAQDPSAPILTGVVRSEVTSAPLPGAVVELAVGGAFRFSVADDAGRYSIDRVPPGRQSIAARHAGYERLELDVWIPADGQVTVDLALAPQPVALPPVTARARRGAAEAHDHSDNPNKPERGLALIGIRAASGTPGLAEVGLTDASGNAPDPGDPGSVLYVRGASTDVKLVLLDGAPVHAPFHLGGVIEPFEPLALGAVNLHLGGAPARHHGGLAYVLELESHEPRSDHVRTAGALDMISARGLLEAPLGRSAGVLLVARRLHGQGAEAFLEDPFPYGYYDALGRADVNLGSGRLAVTGFANRERVRIGLSEEGDLMVGWGNTAGSARYRIRVGETDAVFTLGTGRFMAEVPRVDAPGTSDRGTVRRTRFAADAVRETEQVLLAFGVAVETYTHEQRFAVRSGTAPSAVSAAQGSVFGVYGEAAVGVGERLVLRGGGRAELFSSDPVPYLAPRLSATWTAGDDVVLTLAAGRHHQHVRMLPTTDSDRTNVLRQPGFGSTEFQVAHASDLTLSLDQRVTERVRVGLSGYVKSFDGLAWPPGNDGIRSSGVDVTVSGAAQRVKGWAGYSLGWVWNPQGPNLATPLFSGRHVLSAGLSGALGAASAFDLGIVYGAGLPHAAVIPSTMPAQLDAEVALSTVGTTTRTGYLEGGELDPRGDLDRPYVRLDASVSRTWTPHLRGRDGSLTTYVRLLNALDRRDAIFYLREGSDARPLSPLPILPVLGLEWKF